MKKTMLIFMGCLAVAAGVAAEDARSGAFSFWNAGFGARAIGLGGAYVAAVEDPTAIWWNPAALTRLNVNPDQFNVESTLLEDGRRLDLAAYSHRFDGAGTMGLGFTHFEITGLDGRDEFNQPTAGFLSRQATLALAWAAQVNHQIRLGVSGRGLFHSLADSQALGYSVDLGAWFMPSLGSYFAIGAVLQNAAGRLRWDSGQLERCDPRLRLGVEDRFLSSRLLLSCDLDVPVAESTEPGFHFGAEFWLVRNFALRAGLHDIEPAFGLTWKAYFYEFTYAWQMAELGAAHHAAVGLRF